MPPLLYRLGEISGKCIFVMTQRLNPLRTNTLLYEVDSEYITCVDISVHPADAMMLIPFLKDIEGYLPFRYHELIADAVYESEGNYILIEQNGQTAYIKPQNYEISKKRKYKQDISRRENMEYQEKTDVYLYKNRKMLTVRYDKKFKNRSGREVWSGSPVNTGHS